ncbi:sugar ABC transporter permease [Phototrophicus methaneseepsis]|uniref:Sugar ABC transporter permease n=1 Tax=Phototrophicus methaneseepsis TaxID=2710758 RepID=A0A7S8EAK9_9CHLR|nr:sugar ABC transporter permease [Phototrophicus methaneseepsis]QPC83394.1 sugar ABC transporter permease [Phototrophicus methaneseepsis]
MENTTKLTDNIQTEEFFLQKKEWRDTFIGYAFVLPFLILFTIFTLYPILQGFWISLHDWELVGTNIQFVGLNNYNRLLNDKLFWSSLEHTIVFVILSGPVLVIIGLLFALMLNRKIRGMGIFRTLFYMPNILSVAVVGLIFARIFASDQRGLINAVLIPLGIEPIQWTLDSRLAMPVLAITTLWWTVGFNTLVFLAGLQGIDESLYDAAKVDGANNWQIFRRITLPSLRRSMTFVTVLQVIGSFQVFGQVDVITGGGPSGATRTIVYYIYERSFDYWQLGYGSAMAFVLFILLFVLSIVQLRLREEN